MKNLTRRQFIGTSAMGLLALKAQAIQPFKTRFDAPLYFQFWVVREQLGEDLPGGLKRLSDLGYDGIEMCSPVGYADFVNFYTTDPGEIKQYIEDAGLQCGSSHFVGNEVLGDNVHTAIETAQALGLDAIIMSSANFNEREATLNQWKAFAEASNTAGEVIRDAGLQLGYHNHAIGPELDGTPQFDHLLGMLDPDLVKVQFQIATIREGYDIVEYLEKYAGQYFALHLSDYDAESDEGAPVGSGDVNWADVFAAARKSDIAEYGNIVEVSTDVPFQGVEDSYAYLSKLTL